MTTLNRHPPQKRAHVNRSTPELLTWYFNEPISSTYNSHFRGLMDPRFVNRVLTRKKPIAPIKKLSDCELKRIIEESNARSKISKPDFSFKPWPTFLLHNNARQLGDQPYTHDSGVSKVIDRYLTTYQSAFRKIESSKS